MPRAPQTRDALNPSCWMHGMRDEVGRKAGDTSLDRAARRERYADGDYPWLTSIRPVRVRRRQTSISAAQAL